MSRIILFLHSHDTRSREYVLKTPYEGDYEKKTSREKI
jgi:hypothetical protein